MIVHFSFGFFSQKGRFRVTVSGSRGPARPSRLFAFAASSPGACAPRAPSLASSASALRPGASPRPRGPPCHAPSPRGSAAEGGGRAAGGQQLPGGAAAPPVPARRGFILRSPQDPRVLGGDRRRGRPCPPQGPPTPRSHAAGQTAPQATEAPGSCPSAFPTCFGGASLGSPRSGFAEAPAAPRCPLSP